MKSDPQLRRWYKRFRDRYFANNIPEPREVEIFYAQLEGLHADCDTDDDPPEMDHYVIRINDKHREAPDLAKLCLLHEMAHFAVFPYEKHGKKFQEEMLRLAAAGAFKSLW